MPAKRKLTDAELTTELRSSAPQNMRTFMVSEELVYQIIEKRTYTLIVQTHNESFGFRGKEDVNQKLLYLDQAWNKHVRITVQAYGNENLKVSFTLKTDVK
ncbi:MAG: hypothetical protein ACAH17_01695 [Candidatus Paceibacterota bacterium]